MFLTQAQWDEIDALETMRAKIWKGCKPIANVCPSFRAEYDARLAKHIESIKQAFSYKESN